MKKNSPSLRIALFTMLTFTTLSLYAQEISVCNDDPRRQEKRTWICIDFNEGGSYDYFLQRLQNDLGPGKDADTVDFFFSHHHMKGVRSWAGIERKSWSTADVDITFFSNDNGFVMLSFVDHLGKNLITQDPDIKKMIRKYIRDRLKEVSYVKAKDGVKLRSAPSLKAPVIQTLNFDEEVWVIGGTKKYSQIKAGNKTIKSEWIRIVAGTDSAFVNDIDLVQQNEIPARFLGNHGRVHYYNFVTQKGFDTEMVDKPISPEQWQTYTDSIGKFIALSLVDIGVYEKRKIANRYRIDTTSVERNVPPDPGLFNSFYLYINSGKDSIHIHDEKSDATTSASFVGQLTSLNKYVVRYEYESPSHALYDKTTGERKNFTEGLPYISPDGKYVIDFYMGWTYPDFSNSDWQDEPDPTIEWCQFSVSRLQPNLEFSEVFSVEFDYWIPVEMPNSAFWISDRELILKAVSITNKEARRKMNANQKLRHSDYQYIKVKIVDR